MARTRGGYRGGYRGGSSNRGSNPPRPRLTHFLCIPLVTESSRPLLEDAISKFKNRIIEYNRFAAAPSTVPLSAIRPIDSIHLTLGVMSLESEEKIQAVVDFLNGLDLAGMLASAASPLLEADQPALESKLQVSLQSLESMHDVQSTSVLYVKPADATNRLMGFCEALRKAFVDNEFIQDENRPLKLHATVLNTVYSKAEVGAVKRLDATALLQLFQDFQWVPSLEVESVAICRMGAKKTFDARGQLVKEAYEEIASIPMP